MTYRIRNWERHFENNRTREMKTMAWVPVPNKHDGEGLRAIFEQRDGITIYGCWHLILQVASKCDPRGTLLRDDGTPHTAQSISRKTGWRRVSDIQRALDFCSSSEVGWIEALTPSAAPGCGNPAPDCASRARAEGNRTEGKGREQNTDLSASKPPTCPPCPLADIVKAWNDMATTAGLPKVADVGKDRTRHLQARWRDPYWRDNWRKALDAVPSKPFLMGQTGGGWRADFGWFVTEKAVRKVVEGGFDEAARRDVRGRTQGGGGGSSGSEYAGIGVTLDNRVGDDGKVGSAAPVPQGAAPDRL